jgi:hypothetical protein
MLAERLAAPRPAMKVLVVSGDTVTRNVPDPLAGAGKMT